MNIISSRGASTDPWGTPLVISWDFYCFLLHLCIVFCLLGMNKANNWHYLLFHSVPVLLVAFCGLLVSSMLWLVECFVLPVLLVVCCIVISRAFLRSRNASWGKRPCHMLFEFVQ